MPFLNIIKLSIFFRSIKHGLNRPINITFNFSPTSLLFDAETKISHANTGTTFH